MDGTSPSESGAQLIEKHNEVTLKRKASTAGLGSSPLPRAVKRRASKACQCCRARKVRCNVTEHGAPCTNCRLDEVECIVSESRRKKKWCKDDESQSDVDLRAQVGLSKLSVDVISCEPAMASPQSLPRDHESMHLGTVPRLQTAFPAFNHVPSPMTSTPMASLHSEPTSGAFPFSSFPMSEPMVVNLPYYIKPFPPRIGQDEISYLQKKGALTIPPTVLRNELLKAYIEYVHPFMPLIDLYEFVMIVESDSGILGRISLIVFQAVMFSGVAFVDMQHLRDAGYTTRKEARRDFFLKTRLLYDFDYETDRISLVQALLLLTYFYETPDDQKDTWHWMGVATSVAHTIGLHRNAEGSSMDTKRIKLWKRIWWSTYMRDRLIALGMRRPTRIKSEDFDVPLLTMEDFDFVAIPSSVSCVPLTCTLARDVVKQQEMASLCVQKAKLCLIISRVLTTQYCVLNNKQGLVHDRTTMMLLPRKGEPSVCEVQACDDLLKVWQDELPVMAKLQDSIGDCPAVDLNRAVLHMTYNATLSALHRPQVMPCSSSAEGTSENKGYDLLDCSRRSVRQAAHAITSIAQMLDAADLVKYLPTTGITVLLPAIIIHLLDVKAPDEEVRKRSLRGFFQCMQVMEQLRDLYTAADYSTAFLEAAIRKASIYIVTPQGAHPSQEKLLQPITTVNDLLDAGRRLDMGCELGHTELSRALTPPPDQSFTTSVGQRRWALFEVSSHHPEDHTVFNMSTCIASTPSDSEFSDHYHATTFPSMIAGYEFESFPNMYYNPYIDTAASHQHIIGLPSNDEAMAAVDFDALLNMDAIAGATTMSEPQDDMFAFNDGSVHGFTIDMDFLGHSKDQISAH